MSKPLLSILIPTVVGREEQLHSLMEKIVQSDPNKIIQYNITKHGNEIEIIYCKDNKEMTIGEKREKLYEKANGLYSWQIDDDDDIADNAIELILEAIKNNPGVDCVTFEEYCLMNGREFRSNHSLKYDDWADNFDGYDFVRTPFYKDVIRTEIAKSVPFEKIRYGEDHAWARALKPHLKTEVHIPQQLYRYIHESSPNDFDERYGFDSN